MRRHDTVRTVMTGDPVTVGPDSTFKEIAALLAEHGISAVPVVDAAGAPIGVVSEADLLTRTEHQDQQAHPSRFAGHGRHRDGSPTDAVTAAELMSRHPRTIGPDATVPAAARELAAAGFRRLLVVDDGGRLVGVVARRDLLRPFLRADHELVDDVREQVLWRALWLRPGELEVTVEDGVVTLSGTVERRSEAVLAVRLTQSLPGVVAVRDELAHTWDDLNVDLGTSNTLH